MRNNTEFNRPGLIYARHIVGMMVVALGYIDIYQLPRPLLSWLAAWLVPLVFSGAVAGLYLLFFTKHAKSRWQTVLFTIAWLFLLLAVASPWLNAFNQRERDRASDLKHREMQLNESTAPTGRTRDDKWWADDPLAKEDLKP